MKNTKSNSGIGQLATAAFLSGCSEVKLGHSQEPIKYKMMKRTVKVTILILSIVFVGLSCQNTGQSNTELTNVVSDPANVMIPHESPSPPEAMALNNRIPTELVCMVNDAFMGIKQFPVPVGDKIYYGCCENCVDKLQKSDEFRYGIDPLTNEKVDKVDAYIVRQSEENYAVYYFKSKENFEKYMMKNKS